MFLLEPVIADLVGQEIYVIAVLSVPKIAAPPMEFVSAASANAKVIGLEPWTAAARREARCHV
jgi:hypothetical protein